MDGSHNNVHTISGQFLGFSTVARADGFRVRSLDGPLTQSELSQRAVFVIANPRHPHTLQSKVRPILNACSDEEVALLRNWVRAGGSLLLVSHHMPIPGSMLNLASVFGFKLIDGFATDSSDSTARVPP